MKMRSIVAPTIVAAVLISIPVSVLGQQSPGMMGPGARSMMGPGMMRGQEQNGSGDMMGMTGSCPMMGTAAGEQAGRLLKAESPFLKQSSASPTPRRISGMHMPTRFGTISKACRACGK